jgi:hypothetical protein
MGSCNLTVPFMVIVGTVAGLGSFATVGRFATAGRHIWLLGSNSHGGHKSSRLNQIPPCVQWYKSLLQGSGQGHEFIVD